GRQAAWEAAWRVVERAVAEQQWEQAAGAADARRCVGAAKDQIVHLANHTPTWHPHQCTLLRDVIGNPFRPITLSPTWRTPVVLPLARAAYENRALPAGTL